MVNLGHVISMLVIVFTCSTEAKVKVKDQKNAITTGKKRIDIQVSKWRQAQSAINNLIDESISNEVSKAKQEVKALLEKNIAKHLHEASKKVMEGNMGLNTDGTGDEDDEQMQQDKNGDCQDQFDNCASLAESGVCETSRDAMKRHCERTCELCDVNDDEFPPSVGKPSGDSWTIIGAGGERFTGNSRVQKGTRKASITTAQVHRLLDYVKQHAPHLKLKRIKPGVLKLVRIPESKQHDVEHKLSVKKTPKKKVKHDLQHDNYWSIKENEEHDNEKTVKTNKGPMIHFDLSSIMKDNGDLKENEPSENLKENEPSVNLKDNEPSENLEESEPSMNVIKHKNKPTSEEYLKHICHPMCKKTCISSCAPGCCAGEHLHDFPLYHRKSSHCHPFCKKDCISSCPLTCCADTHRTSKTWHHPRVNHFTPGCHPMCKKNCVPSCPKACCTHKPAKRRSHCHPLCKTNCLSSCPLSCCSRRDRLKEKCHPLCRKTCLPSCPDECCTAASKKLITKSNPVTHDENNKDKEILRTTCPGSCPDSCAPACHDGCCNSDKEKKMENKGVTHVTPSGCTANCVYACLPGCPPACCMKSLLLPAKVYGIQQQTNIGKTSPAAAIPFTQPEVTSFAVPNAPQPVMSVYQPEVNQPVVSSYSQVPSFERSVPRQSETTSQFAPKHCPSACLTHCSPECARSDCCDLID